MKKRKLIIFCLCFILLFSLVSIKIKAETYVLEVDVNAPYTIEEVMELTKISASKAGVDYSESIVSVYSDDYINDVLNRPKASMRRCGLYALTFQAEDNKGKKSLFEIYLNVVDKTAPIFLSEYSVSTVSISKSEIEKFGEGIIKKRVIESVKAIDMVDLFDVSIDADCSSVSLEGGTYGAKVVAKDKSNNVSYYDIEIVIIDNIKPYFELDTDYMLANAKENLTAEVILDRVNMVCYLSDGVDIDVKTDDDRVFNKPGIYVIEYHASSNGKTSSFNFYLEVIDDSEMEFSVDDSVFVLEKDVLYTKEDISAFIKLKAKNDDFTFDVIKDEYSENYDKEGEYEYLAHLTYEDKREEDLRLILKVSKSEKIEKEVEKEKGFFEKAWDLIKKVSLIILQASIFPFKYLISLIKGKAN